MTLEYLLKQKGLYNEQNITLNFDIQFALTGPAFEGGTGDYCTLFEPTASEFEKANKGFVVASIGEESGEIPYTSFIALDSYLKDNSDKVEKFIKAMYKAINYVKTAPSSEVAKELVKHFKGSDLAQTSKSLENYLSVDTWMTDMSLPESMYNTLIAVINNAGEQTNGVLYSKVVDNSFATKGYQNSLKS